MSVRTAADEHRDKALEHINDAIANIAAIVVEQVSGWDDYNEKYSRELRLVLYFFKSWGRWRLINGIMLPLGKKRAGRLLDGRTWDEMPRRQP